MKTPERPIILCGIKHCGKSTQAKKIAAALKIPAYDTDDIIRERTGMDARAIYKTRGKEAFMKAEAEACDYLRGLLAAAPGVNRADKNALQDQECAASDSQNASANQGISQDKNCAAVIATGGGICENEEAKKILKALGTIVYLKIDEKAACDRIVREAKFFPGKKIENLPAYIAEKKPKTESDVRAIFREFYAARTKKYERLANVAVDMRNGSKEENAQKILSALQLL